MLTVPHPLAEGMQTTSNTHTPSPTETQAWEKTAAFAGKFDLAMSEKNAGEAGSTDKLSKTGKETKPGVKAPKKGGKSFATNHAQKLGRKIGADVIARGAQGGVGADGAKAAKAVTPNGDLSSLLATLQTETGENAADLIASDTTLMETQSPELKPADAADQKVVFPEEGGASLVLVSTEAGNNVETVAEGALAGERRGGNENGSPSGKNGKNVIEVRDFRTRETVEPSDGHRHTEIASGETGEEGTKELEREGSEPQIRLVRASSGNGSGNETASVRQTRSDGFAAYVRESVSNQLVRQSGIILRNNNQGEIRLVLKPEHLGRVRLRIQLDENRLTGRIFVDSSFVKESFEQNLEALYRAFRNSGFEASGFEVFVDGGSGEDGTSKDPGKLAAKTLKQLDDAVPILEEIDQQSELINLVV